MSKDKVLAIVCVIVLLIGTVYFYNEKQKEDEEEEPVEVEPMLNATRNYLAMGKSITIPASALYANLNDGFTGNDPFILSIRSAADYEKGHIPGAVNIPRTTLFTPENLSKLPMHKQIVVVCYTGHTASQTAAMLSVVGYDATALKFGMGSWTTNTTVAGSYYHRDTDANNFPVYIGSMPGDLAGAKIVGTDMGQCGGDEPVDTGGGAADDNDLAGRIHTSINSGKPVAMTAPAVMALLNDSDPSNDPFILSVRSASQYEMGHIPGAINIGFRTLFTDENLSLLPKDDRLIVVVCYTGHTASQATALLNINGFNATALKFGMTSWTNNATVAPSFYVREKDCMNYPIINSTKPGTWAEGIVVGTDIEEPADVLGATRDYLASGKSTTIPASALYSTLNDGFTGNDPFILSIRSAADYEKGHIPTAVNIPRTSLFTEENMSKLPHNRQIVVVCYTGHTASQVTALLNVAGYDAIALKFGMSSWTNNVTVAGSYYHRDTDVSDLPVIIGPDPGDVEDAVKVGGGSRQCGGDDPPVDGPASTGGADISDVAYAYMNSGKALTMKATDVWALLNDSDPSNDPFMLSIRSATQYAAGHIPGAVNIGFKTVFTDENLSKLPTDDTLIVVVCYTGHTASQMAAMLNINGFNATAMKFGMTSWTNNETVAPMFYVRETDCHNYPIINSTKPGTWAEGIVVGTDFEEPADVLGATRDYLASGKSTTIPASALYANLNDGFTGNDPFILSIRSATDYEKGHIPGAVNIPRTSLFTEENLSKLPHNKQIVVVCYTGHSASQVTALLNVAGFDAIALKFGMGSWTTNTTVAGSYYHRDTDVGDYPVFVGDRPGDMANSTSVGSGSSRQCGDDPPVDGPASTGGADVSEVAHAYMNSGKPLSMKASDLFALINDSDPTNDPFILSIRSASQYAAGHIPGAINIGFRTVFTDENLSKLPTDDTLIVVVCYTGHTASQMAALLNINGFNATALKFGMTSWTDNETVAPMYYNRESDCQNYPIINSTQPGTWAEGVVVGPPVIDVLGATRDYLASGKSLTISANALYANLNDGFTGNDPFILSIRGAADYEKGHIPGAVNIDRKGLFTEENLSKLPHNKQIVVVCYTGHSASQVTALLNVAGFDAITLKFGMGSWTTNTTVAGSYYHRDTDANNFPVFIGEEPGDMANSTPVGSRDCGDDNGGGTVTAMAGADISEVANNYMNSGKPLTMKATDLFALLNDTDPTNDPFVLSIRAASQYEKGHIPGAINIGFKTLFTEENLSKLPKDDTLIVVVCYTGHSASQAAALLNINGYNATALKFGMTSWTDNETVAPMFYVRGKDCKNYPVVTGTDPGTIADGVVVGLTTEDIIMAATLAYMEEGPRTIDALALYDLLNDTDATNDPFVLSIRDSALYELGHVPGAINIQWEDLFTLDNLGLLPANDTMVVVVSDTGQTAGQMTALLNLLGFNASSLRFGMTAWTANSTIGPGAFNKTTDQADYPMSNGTDPGDMGSASSRSGSGGSRDVMGALYAGTAEEWEVLRQAIADYVAGIDTMTISNKALFNNLDDNYTANDPFVLSIRNSTAYELAHIPGAVNIQVDVLFEEANLALLPKDRQIVVYCGTGQTSAHIVSLLNMLGYDAVSLEFGVCSWTDNSTIADQCFDEAVDGNNFPICTGSSPGDWASAAPADED